MMLLSRNERDVYQYNKWVASKTIILPSLVACMYEQFWVAMAICCSVRLKNVLPCGEQCWCKHGMVVQCTARTQSIFGELVYISVSRQTWSNGSCRDCYERGLWNNLGSNMASNVWECWKIPHGTLWYINCSSWHSLELKFIAFVRFLPNFCIVHTAN